MILEGWGRFPRHSCRVSAPRSEIELQELIAEGNVIARGCGRAYGDSAISPQNTVDMRHFNRMLEFNPVLGQLITESGVVLADIIDVFLPRGWFPSVTPGTKIVTIGGMIAADVHGKNHHKHGSFGNFIDWIDVMVANGNVLRCSPGQNSDLFNWTVGGMGLTGVVLRASFRLRPVETSWIKQTIIPAPNLEAAMEAFEQSQNSTYSVAWIDCLSKGAALGRSLVMLGEHAAMNDLSVNKRVKPYETPAKRKLTVPFNAPSFALNSLLVRTFNAFYYRNGVNNSGEGLIDWNGFFYPLDAIHRWNRIYGRKGLAQFQCVLPLSSSTTGLQALLTAISNSGQGSFLAVLKRFGEQESFFSFPMEGYTLALDFPITKKTLVLLSDLDRITIEYGGRFYLAKDSRMTAETLRKSDSRSQSFAQTRRASGSNSSFTSAQSERLEL
jgi:decaprenylphospho-beta-D-ribofuranose 2-oxidase